MQTKVQNIANKVVEFRESNFTAVNVYSCSSLAISRLPVTIDARETKIRNDHWLADEPCIGYSPHPCASLIVDFFGSHYLMFSSCLYYMMKTFPHYWPFVRMTHRSLWYSPPKGPLIRAFGNFYYLYEQAIEQTDEWFVIWCTTALKWRGIFCESKIRCSSTNLSEIIQLYRRKCIIS